MTAHLIYPINNVLFSYSINYIKEVSDFRNYKKAIFIFLLNIIFPLNIFFIFKNNLLKLWVGIENFQIINSFLLLTIFIFITKSISEIASSFCVTLNKAEKLFKPRLLLLSSLAFFFLISKNLDLNSFVYSYIYLYSIIFFTSYVILIKTSLFKFVNYLLFIIFLFYLLIFLPIKFTNLNILINIYSIEINIYFLVMFFINLVLSLSFISKKNKYI